MEQACVIDLLLLGELVTMLVHDLLEAFGIGGPYPALFFSGLFTLRRRRRDCLQKIFCWRFVAKSHVRTALIIIDPPSLNQVVPRPGFRTSGYRRKAEALQTMFEPLRQGRSHNSKGCYIRYIFCKFHPRVSYHL